MNTQYESVRQERIRIARTIGDYYRAISEHYTEWSCSANYPIDKPEIPAELLG